MKTKFDKYDRFRSSQAHIRYMKNDKQVPGITTITKYLTETDPIAIWANNLGLANINMLEYRRELAVIGTLWHYMIECNLMNKELDLNEYTPRQIEIAKRLMDKFLMWKQGKKVIPLGMELPLVSKEYGYGGTSDYIGYINDKLSLMDFKSTESIKMEHKSQAVACAKLWNDHNPDKQIEKIYILKASRDMDMSVDFSEVGSIELYWELFLALLKVHELVNKIKKEG